MEVSLSSNLALNHNLRRLSSRRLALLRWRRRPSSLSSSSSFSPSSSPNSEGSASSWLQVGDDLNYHNLTDLAKKFGDIFLLRMGQHNLMVISSPKLTKEVLYTQGVEFGSQTRNVVFDIFTCKGQGMVFTV